MACCVVCFLLSSSVLDPILHELLDPSIRCVHSVTKLNGKELQDFAYEGHLDQRLMNHLLDTLLSIIRFGGQGFSKVTRSTPFRRSLHSELIQRGEAGKQFNGGIDLF